VLNKANGGYGAAVNLGLDAAKGEFLSIIEPDDWVKPTMYADMLKFADTFAETPDIIKTPFWEVPSDQDIAEGAQPSPNSYYQTVRPGHQPFTIEHTPLLIEHHPSIWSALYRLDFLRDNNIRFKEAPGAGWVDNPFLLDTMLRAKQIVYLDEPYYCYRVGDSQKSDDFFTRSWSTAFDRYAEMNEIIAKLRIDDPGLLRSHYRRGIYNLNQTLRFHDLAKEPEVREAVRSMLAAMDHRIVFADPDVSNEVKQLFVDLLGIPTRELNRLNPNRPSPVLIRKFKTAVKLLLGRA
jgi:glycosyltransferase involved in cell wall biosynthesis